VAAESKERRRCGRPGYGTAMASPIKTVSFDAADASHTVMQDPRGNEFCVEPGPVA
jgi:hypothetical protein